MTGPGCSGGGLLQLCVRAQPEVGTSGRVLSGHDPEPCGEVEKGERGARSSS